jgi:hypothetical protein
VYQWACLTHVGSQQQIRDSDLWRQWDGTICMRVGQTSGPNRRQHTGTGHWTASRRKDALTATLFRAHLASGHSLPDKLLLPGQSG